MTTEVATLMLADGTRFEADISWRLAKGIAAWTTEISHGGVLRALGGRVQIAPGAEANASNACISAARRQAALLR